MRTHERARRTEDSDGDVTLETGEPAAGAATKAAAQVGGRRRRHARVVHRSACPPELRGAI